MSRIYYPLRYRMNHKDRWLIWHTSDAHDEPDKVILTTGMSVVAFRDCSSLVDYALAQGLSPLENGNSSFCDFDTAAIWMNRKRPAKLDCRAFLSAWNLLGDVASSLGTAFDTEKQLTNAIYDKLFWGSNLPALTPKGKRYEPRWSGEESRILRQVMGNGLKMFCGSISLQPK